MIDVSAGYGILVVLVGDTWEPQPDHSHGTSDAPFWDLRMDTEDAPSDALVNIEGEKVLCPVFRCLHNPKLGYVRSSVLYPPPHEG